MSNTQTSSDLKKFQSIISSFIFLCAVALLIYGIAQLGISFKAKSAAQLERLWSEDITQLKASGGLPVYWDDVKEVEKNAALSDPIATLWVKTVAVPISVNPNGNYKLEILIISQKTDNGNRAAIIQHHLTEIATGNSVWELSRFYEL